MVDIDPEKPRLPLLARLRNQFSKLASTSVAFTTSLPLPAPADDSLRARAFAHCARAHHGHYCRTNMFLRNGDMAEWMEGRQDPQTNKWITRIVIEAINLSGDGAPLGAKIQQFITLDSHLDFMDAIAKLSKYERDHIASGTLSVPDDIVDNLGNDHVVTFAENNDIVFDINGIPHPTFNGEIVTDGLFSKDAIARARTLYAKAPGAIRPANFFITTQTSANIDADTAQLINTAIDLATTLSHANDLHKHIAALAKVTHILFQEPAWETPHNQNERFFRWANWQIKERVMELIQPTDIQIADLRSLSRFMIENNCFFEPQRDKTKDTLLTNTYNSLLDESCRIVNLFGLPDGQRDQIVTDLETIRLYADVMYLRGILRDSIDDSHHHRQTLAKAKSEIPGLQQRYTALCDTPNTGWKIASIIFDDQIPDISPVFTRLTHTAETLRVTFSRAHERAKNHVISGAYASAAAPSGPPSISLTPP